MRDTFAIRAEGLGKRYHINSAYRPLALHARLESMLRAPLQRVPAGDGQGPGVWALQDVSFQVQEGEVVGMVGANGAGKSVLLKILARVTRPTTGQADVYGRVGAMLEVGTGFHPELTGRENITLSAAILGMRRREINQHFDAIVAFSELERFLDTPVKRYSSGMLVRLAFGVAAHLEPEIMLIDEVLAVADERFQAKCLETLRLAASQGRTILLVSHDRELIASLCPRVLLLHEGKLVDDGEAESVLADYHARQQARP